MTANHVEHEIATFPGSPSGAASSAGINGTASSMVPPADLVPRRIARHTLDFSSTAQRAAARAERARIAAGYGLLCRLRHGDAFYAYFTGTHCYRRPGA
jgi:hypothetical protein